MIASLGSIVCIILERFLYTKQGKWHFSRFSIIVGEIMRDMQGFQRGERGSIGSNFVTRGYGCIIFYEMETQAAACGFLPAEIFIH